MTTHVWKHAEAKEEHMDSSFSTLGLIFLRQSLSPTLNARLAVSKAQQSSCLNLPYAQSTWQPLNFTCVLRIQIHIMFV